MPLEYLTRSRTNFERANFLQNSVPLIARLYRAIEAQKPLEWIEAAGMLREAADEAGYEPVMILCRDLEMIADRGRVQDTKIVFGELSAELERIRWEG
jgi:hypothetical protein